MSGDECDVSTFSSTPGTIIVDIRRRIAQRATGSAQADILFTEGGVLHSPQPINQLRYWQPEWAQVMHPVREDADVASNPFEITGCVLSGVLSSRFGELHPTIGMVDAQTCLQHYAALSGLGLKAAALHCQDYLLPEALIDDFRGRFADR